MKAYADCVISALRNKKPDWEIVEYYPSSLFYELSKKNNIISKIIDFTNRYIYYLLQVKRCKADVYHIVDHGNALLIESLDRDKAVVTCHDVIPYLMAKGYFKGIKKPPLALKIFIISMRYLKRARLIFADSENTRNDLVEWLKMDKDKVVVVHSGSFYPYRRLLEEEIIKHKKVLGINEGKLIILHVGNNLFYKNFDRILAVLSRMPDKINNREWIFFHIGQRYGDEFINIHYKGKHRERIKDMGVLRYEELEKYYNMADILLFPSLYEGFGMPVLEAMQCGLPVITSNVASLKEIGGDAVKYVNPYNIENMLEVLLNVLNDSSLREKMRESGLERAKMFTWDSAITKMISYYEMV